MRAFTLLEMVFVLVIIGILSFIGVEYIPNNRPISDSEVLKKLILTKKTNAIGYKTYKENNYTCIELNMTKINEEENLSKVKYRFKSTLTIKGLNGNIICFDDLGRPYDGAVEINLSNMIKNFVIISLSYKNKEKNFTMYPISGYIR
jgi:prepilin-type N-terminal cleavage/methylation domain-containing protein